MSRITFNLLGPQGSGKGTQASALMKYFDFTLFDLGENLRHIRDSDNPLGKEIAPFMDDGLRVPPDLIANVTLEQLQESPIDKDILFDGLLRSLEELPYQEKTFTSLDLPLPVIIFLNLDEATAIDRLAHRRICANCGNRVTVPDPAHQPPCPRCGGKLIMRHDDTPEAIKHRLAWYHSDTIPVVEHFRSLGRVIDIDAKPAIEVVTEEVVEKVCNYYDSLGTKPRVKS